MSTTLQSLAGAMYDAFIRKTRDNGDIFYCLADGAPEWMNNVCLAGHDDGNMFPDDYRYETIKEACGAIHDAGEDADPADVGDEFTDAVDVYTAHLLAWVSTRLSRTAYVDDAMSEYGSKTLSDALMAGQSMERREIFDAVHAALDAELQSRDDAEA